MIDLRNSLFEYYSDSFALFTEPAQNEILGALSELSTEQRAARAAKSALCNDPKARLQTLAPRFVKAYDFEKDAIIALFAKAHSELGRTVHNAALALLSPVNPPVSPVNPPVKKRPRLENPLVKNRAPLPEAVQRFILEQKLYLLYSLDASKEIEEKFNTTLGETALSSAYQATGNSDNKWPARDYIHGRITEKEALERVLERFSVA